MSKFSNVSQPETSNVLERTALVWKTALGSVIAWNVAGLTGSRHPYLAPLTLILCLQSTIGQSLQFAFYRSIGTVAGVLLIGFFAKELPITVWTLGLLLFLSTGLLKLLRANDTLIHQVALSILFVLYFEHHSQGYAWDRAKDTLIGSLVAVVFTTLIVPVNETKRTMRALRKFVRNFAGLVDRTADALRNNDLFAGSLRQDLRALFGELQQISQSFTQTRKGIPFNLYAASGKATLLQWQLQNLQDAYMHFAALGETLTAQLPHQQRDQWSDKLHVLAGDIRSFAVEEPGRPTVTLPSQQSSNRPFSSEVAVHESEKIVESLNRGRIMSPK